MSQNGLEVPDVTQYAILTVNKDNVEMRYLPQIVYDEDLVLQLTVTALLSDRVTQGSASYSVTFE